MTIVKEGTMMHGDMGSASQKVPRGNEAAHCVQRVGDVHT